MSASVTTLARTAYGSCRTRGKRADAFPTGPWTAQERAAHNAPQALAVYVHDQEQVR